MYYLLRTTHYLLLTMSKLVDVELQVHGVVGSNSIPNQAALLTGCTAVHEGAESPATVSRLGFEPTRPYPCKPEPFPQLSPELASLAYGSRSYGIG